jgi:hypothetical protein
MKTNKSKRTISIAAVTLIALSSVPARGGTDGSCVDGLNSTGMSCRRGGDALDSSSALKPVTNTLNYLKNSNDCNGILNRPDEIAFLRKVDAVNADFMEGKISLEQRGKVLAAAAKIAAAKSTDPRASNILFGDELELSTRTQETYANLIYLNEQHGIKPTQDQTAVLARMGIKPEDQAAYIQNSSKHLDPGIKAMIAAGMRLKPDGTWDLSKMNNKLTPGSIDPTLNSAVGYFMSPDSASDLKNPNRTDAMFRGDTVVLPALKDAQGNRTGKIQVVDTAAYKAQLDQTLQEFHDAAKEAEAASMASTSATNLFAQHAGKNTAENKEKTEAFAKMDKSIEELKALGYPATGKNAPMVQVLGIASALANNYKSAFDAGMANVEKTQHIIKVTAWTALGGTLLVGAAKVADLAEAGEDYNAIKAEKGAQAAAQAYKDAGFLGKAGTYLRLANTAFDKKGLMNMANMAAMPWVFSGGSSAINGLIDSLTDGTHGGSFGCRFANSFKAQEGSNIAMANFAWATPAITMVGGVAEIASVAKLSGGTISTVLNTGQAVGFGAIMLKSGATDSVAAGSAGLATIKAAFSGDSALAKADAIDFAKKSVQAGTDLWFAKSGLEHIGADTLHSAAGADGNIGTAARNQLAIQDRVTTGEYKPGDVIKEKDVKGSYTVVDTSPTNVDPVTKKPFIIAMADNAGSADHGKLYKIYPEDINAHLGDTQAGQAIASKIAGGANQKMTILENPYEKADALVANGTKGDTGTSTIKYNSKDAAKIAEGQAKVRSLQGEEVPAADTTTDVVKNDGVPKFESIEDIVKNDPNSPLVKVRNRVVDSLKKIADKTWGKYESALNDNSIIERVVGSFSKEELTTLDKKIENKPKEVTKNMEEIFKQCGLDGKPIEGAWDTEGVFKGILYAENEASCDEL